MYMPDRVFSADVLEESNLYEVPSQEAVDQFLAEPAVEMLVDLARHIYLPFRGQTGYGTERAVIVAPPHALHRENDAEHSWFITEAALRLYENREMLRMPFPKGFSLLELLKYSHGHDLGELRAPDVNATAKNRIPAWQKKANDRTAWKGIGEEFPYMKKASEDGLQFEEKKKYEYQLGSDFDKVGGTLVIAVVGGGKWHDWEGESTTMEYMFETYEEKVITPVGKKLMLATKQYLAQRPYLFPEDD
jgi:hypothetical protein